MIKWDLIIQYTKKIHTDQEIKKRLKNIITLNIENNEIIRIQREFGIDDDEMQRLIKSVFGEIKMALGYSPQLKNENKENKTENKKPFWTEEKIKESQREMDEEKENQSIYADNNNADSSNTDSSNADNNNAANSNTDIK